MPSIFPTVNKLTPEHMVHSKGLLTILRVCFRIHIERQQAQIINTSTHLLRPTRINININTLAYQKETSIGRACHIMI